MMKKYLGWLMVAVCILLSGCGTKAPSEQQIMEDLEGEITTIAIQNPFTGDFEEQELEITDLKIERSQTKNTTYKAYCIVEMENEIYSYTQYWALEYERYDGNDWLLEEGYEYEEAEVVVSENPFVEEDFANNCIDDEGYSNLQIDTIINDNTISVICSYEIGQTYSVAKTTIYADYRLDGRRWVNYNYSERVDNEWQIEGNWKLCEVESGSGILFRLQIESFDSETLRGEGQCKFGYTTFMGEKKLETYSISEAKIYENGDKLVIWFDGGDNIEIGQDKSTAFCGAWIKKIEWASPNYISVEPEKDNTSLIEEDLVDNSIAEPEYYKANCLVVNGDIMCWGGATHSWDVNGKRYSSTTSILEFVYSGENLQSMNWYHILESEEEARDLAIYVYENDGVCWGYEGKIKASYCGNVLKIEESISTVDESHQTRNGNIAYYQSWGFDIIYM